MKNFFTKSVAAALLTAVAIIATVSSLQLNWSLIHASSVNLTIVMHIVQIVAVAMIIVLNKNVIVDYVACFTLLISGIKPANTLVNSIFGKIEGTVGAVIPIVALIVMVLVIVGLFVMAYRTNHLAASKTLIIAISVAGLITSVVIGFLYNVLAASNGSGQIGLVTGTILSSTATILLVISFFLTKEEFARLAILVAGLMTIWTFINELVVMKVVEKVIALNSYKVKGIIPIALGILAFETGKLGIKLFRTSKAAESEDTDNQGDEENQD